MSQARAKVVKQYFEQALESEKCCSNWAKSFPKQSEFLLDIDYAYDALYQVLEDLRGSKKHHNKSLRCKNPYPAGSKLDTLVAQLIQTISELSEELEQDLREPYHIKYFREVYVAGLQEMAGSSALN